MNDALEELQSGAVLAQESVNILTRSPVTELRPPYYDVELPLGNTQLRLYVGRGEPSWIWTTLDRISKLGSFTSDWDSYGGDRTQRNAVAIGIELLAAVMGPETPAPAIIPTSSGGIQLEWHQSGIDLEVEVSPQGEVSMLFERVETEELIETNAVSLKDLQRAVAQLI